MTLSKKYALLTMNEKGDIGSLFGFEKNGLYVSALLELYYNQIVGGRKKVIVLKPLPIENNGVKVMYDIITQKEHKSLASIMRHFMSPFSTKLQKQLKYDVLESLDQSTTSEHIDDILRDIESLADAEAIVLAKIIIEMKVAKHLIPKETRRSLKKALKNDEHFSEEIKDILRVIDSLGTAGALAGAGVV